MFCCLGGVVSAPLKRGRCPPAGSTKLLNFTADYTSDLKTKNKLKLSTTDLLVLASMKNAAKCDK
jgi:hypothetical protein